MRGAGKTEPRAARLRGDEGAEKNLKLYFDLVEEASMGRKQSTSGDLKFVRPERVKLSREESLKRMREFSKRKGKFIAAIRKGKDRSVSA